MSRTRNSKPGLEIYVLEEQRQIQESRFNMSDTERAVLLHVFSTQAGGLKHLQTVWPMGDGSLYSMPVSFSRIRQVLFGVLTTSYPPFSRASALSTANVACELSFPDRF